MHSVSPWESEWVVDTDWLGDTAKQEFLDMLRCCGFPRHVEVDSTKSLTMDYGHIRIVVLNR